MWWPLVCVVYDFVFFSLGNEISLCSNGSYADNDDIDDEDKSDYESVTGTNEPNVNFEYAIRWAIKLQEEEEEEQARRQEQLEEEQARRQAQTEVALARSISSPTDTTDSRQRKRPLVSSSDPNPKKDGNRLG